MSASDWIVTPALCLDLDGTVRYNRRDPAGFIDRAEDIAIYPGVEEKLWKYREGNPSYLILGVSNQGGAAFDYKTSVDVDREIAATIGAFERNPFHIIKCCLHHEGGKVEPYAHRSLLRKPDYGMLAVMEAEAFDESFVIDWDRSIMVGDREEDRELANRAGLDFLWADSFFARQS